MSDYAIVKDGGIIHCVYRPGSQKYIKNYFDFYDYEKNYFLIKNQKINGLWEANTKIIKFIEKYGLSFTEFSKKIKDIYSINDINIIFTLFIMSFLNNFSYKQRFKYILEKSKNLLMEKIKDYNEIKQREFETYIYY